MLLLRHPRCIRVVIAKPIAPDDERKVVELLTIDTIVATFTHKTRPLHVRKIVELSTIYYYPNFQPYTIIATFDHILLSQLSTICVKDVSIVLIRKSYKVLCEKVWAD